jgi:hypothetical protein
MTTEKSPELFQEAESRWDLERLLDDLAEVNGESLTATEQLTLRGLLCGYTPAELTEMRVKDKRGPQTNVSRGVRRYVKKLMRAKGVEVPERLNSVKMLAMLKKAGYNKTVTTSTDDKEKNPMISVQGPVKVTGGMTFKKINTWNKEYVHIEIEKLGVTLSAEQLGDLVNTLVSGDDEKKQLVNILVNLVKTVVGGEKQEKR